MCACVCTYVCVCADMAAFDWQHTQYAPDKWGTSRFACRAATCVVCYISIYDVAAIPFPYIFFLFFFLKRKWALKSNTAAAAGKMRSWVRRKYEMFITVDKYLHTLFAFFLLISLACSLPLSLYLFFFWLLATRLTRSSPLYSKPPFDPVSLMTFPDCMFD